MAEAEAEALEVQDKPVPKAMQHGGDEMEVTASSEEAVAESVSEAEKPKGRRLGEEF